MNPLVLITLIGGAHNDAIMAGFLVVGIALAVKRHPVWALVFCSCAAAIKAPAAFGLAFVAWTWLGPKASIRDRLRPIGIAVIVAAATLGVWTWLAGFGFGWVQQPALERHRSVVGRPGDRGRPGADEYVPRSRLARYRRSVRCSR